MIAVSCRPRSFDYEYVQEGNSWIVQSNIDPGVLPAPVSIKDSYLQVLFYSVQKVCILHAIGRQVVTASNNF